MPISRDCQYCAERFTTSIERRVFCSDKCKTRYHRQERLACFYCGELGTTKDHLYPQVYGNGAGDIVKACSECNSTLRAFAAESVQHRVGLLYETYVKKYQLRKPIPEWDDAELAELGLNLRSAIGAKIRQRQRALERVAHIHIRHRALTKY